jgi:hypothetical protein
MDLLKSVSYRGEFSEVCDNKHALKFMSMVSELKEVNWRSNIGALTENEIILCTMLEKNISCEINIKGAMLMYVRSGRIYRQMVKHMADVYKRYDSHPR